MEVQVDKEHLIYIEIVILAQLTDFIGDSGSNVYRTTFSFGGQDTTSMRKCRFKNIRFAKLF